MVLLTKGCYLKNRHRGSPHSSSSIQRGLNSLNPLNAMNFEQRAQLRISLRVIRIGTDLIKINYFS